MFIRTMTCVSRSSSICRTFGERDGLGLIARLRGQVNSNRFAHLEHNVLTVQRLKSFRFDADSICAGREGGRVKLPRRIRGQGSREASLRVYDGHRGSRQHCSSLVCNGSQNTAEIALRKQREREQHHTQDRSEHPPGFSGWCRIQCYEFHKHPLVFKKDERSSSSARITSARSSLETRHDLK